MSAETSGRRPVTALAAAHIGQRVRLTGDGYDITGYLLRVATAAQDEVTTLGSLRPYIAYTEVNVTMRMGPSQDWDISLWESSQFEVIP